MSTLTSEELHLLRAKDIKKLLTSIGIDRRQVSSILDKDELVAMALKYYADLQQQKQQKILFDYMTTIFIYAIIIIVIVIFRKALWATLAPIGQSMWGEYWVFTEKSRLIKKAYKYKIPLALLAVLISCSIDICIPLINVSTLLSWCLGADSYFRRYLFPSPYIPLSQQSITGRGSTFGLNIGPMLMLWALKLCKDKCENYAAAQILRVASARRKKKDDDNFFGASAADETSRFTDWKEFKKECNKEGTAGVREGAPVDDWEREFEAAMAAEGAGEQSDAADRID